MPSVGEVPSAAVADALEEVAALIDEDLPRRFWPSNRPWERTGAALIARLADLSLGVAREVRDAALPEAGWTSTSSRCCPLDHAVDAV